MTDEYKSASDSLLPKHVIIIGGSLSALMHGLILHRLGSSVRILERSLTDTPPSHMAGVCLGPDVLHFLDRFDRVPHHPIGIPSEQLQSLDQHGTVHPFLKARRIMSSWDALYFRLRANFDMLASAYVPHPPPPQPLPGEHPSAAKSRASYETGKEVVRIHECEEGDRVAVLYRDHMDGGREVRATADLVLGADGPNSVVRAGFLDRGMAERRYAGYLAWRGVVPEDQVGGETREKFRANITYSMLGGEGGHVILYNIPGEGGSVEPGKRLLNFCWYQNTGEADLERIMTDVDGVRHHTKLAPGKVDPKVWEAQREYARTCFASPYLDVIDRIRSPFVHLITDYCSPRASFAGGKVLLVGDATTLLRPHIAFSTNQAAYQAFLTEKLVTGGITRDVWEYQVTTATHLHWKRSIWFGDFFQRPLYVSLRSAVQYWLLSALARWRMWVGWLPKQAI